MKRVIAFLPLLLFACDPSRIEEDQIDLAERTWVHQRPLHFTFLVHDPAQPYNLIVSLRNSEDYPYSRFYFTWRLADSVGHELDSKLESLYFFDPKSGKPYGRSAIGDIFSHDLVLHKGYLFPYRGRFTVSLQQAMREDSLRGIVSTGFRIEKAKARQETP